MQDYKDLKVWEKGHALTLKVYSITKMFPKEEMYALSSQMRRSASSIPMNIAEGCGRIGNKEFAHFCDIAIGSSNELEYQLILAKDLKYIGLKRFTDLTELVVEIRKMLFSFVKKLKK
ncbi:MAG: four helix bundle protein [Fibrobacteria bacterium]|nr:four helix bundle protein [Fibrobacteria bacterium]